MKHPFGAEKLPEGDAQTTSKPFYRGDNLERNKRDKFEAEVAKENLEVVKNPLFF
jgi:hypothetical protein